jgi:HK97 family phage prohead protease
MEREIRFATGAELRMEDGDKPKIKGYAAVFDTPADIGGMFTERVRSGAFKKTISEADIRCLWNHDPNYIMGRNKSGTLRLQEDAFGLSIECDPVDAQWCRDLQASMRRGDVNQMSFAFKAIQEGWDNTTNERSLIEVKLFDVSVVTYPAYPQATAQLRTSVISNIDILTGILFRASRGVKLSDMDVSILKSHADMIRSYLPQSDETPQSEPENHLEPDSHKPETDHLWAELCHRADVERILMQLTIK